jgi:hypothetical protein
MNKLKLKRFIKLKRLKYRKNYGKKKITKLKIDPILKFIF